MYVIVIFIKESKEAILLLTLLLCNFFTKAIICYEINYRFIYPSTIVKLGLFLLLLFSFFKRIKEKSIKNLFILPIFGLIILWLIGILLTDDLDFKYIVEFKIKQLVRFLFLFLFIPFYIQLMKQKKHNIINILLYFAVINTGLVYIGFIYDINVFKSYPSTERFGYNGLLPSQGMGTYFYMFTILVSYYSYVKFKEKKWRLIILILGSLLLGTKAIYLFLAILVFTHIIINIKQKMHKLFFFLFSLIGGIFLWEKVLEFSLTYLSFSSVYERHGLLTYITSYRDLLLKQAYNYIINNWSNLNYLVGGGDFRLIRTEFEFVDIFLFFGAIGLVLYIIYIKTVFYKKGSTIFNIGLGIILIVSCLTGNLFSSITNSLLFVITLLYMRESYVKKLT